MLAALGAAGTPAKPTDGERSAADTPEKEAGAAPVAALAFDYEYSLTRNGVLVDNDGDGGEWTVITQDLDADPRLLTLADLEVRPRPITPSRSLC